MAMKLAIWKQTHSLLLLTAFFKASGWPVPSEEPGVHMGILRKIIVPLAVPMPVSSPLRKLVLKLYVRISLLCRNWEIKKALEEHSRLRTSARAVFALREADTVTAALRALPVWVCEIERSALKSPFKITFPYSHLFMHTLT
jgi:hypothetical protein